MPLRELDSPFSGYECVLDLDANPYMRNIDRIAFAARFLPDRNLSKYVEDLCEHVRRRGDLSGIVLQGANATCVPS